MENKNFYSKAEISAMMTAYANLVKDEKGLEDARRMDERSRIAKRIKSETIPAYKHSVPQEFQHMSINVAHLEKICERLIID
jgi:hypothetical protein